MVYLTDFTGALRPQLSGLEAAGRQHAPAAAAPGRGAPAPRRSGFRQSRMVQPQRLVKDRPALNILRTALCGRLARPAASACSNSTSGNMGIAYATFGAALGIPVTLALPANASPERITILHALGAELMLTDPLEGSDGALRVARQLAAEQPERYFYANQYDNPANWQAHYQTTGPEIVQQTGGRVTHFVAGLGTTGTLTGVGPLPAGSTTRTSS